MVGCTLSRVRAGAQPHIAGKDARLVFYACVVAGHAVRMLCFGTGECLWMTFGVSRLMCAGMRDPLQWVHSRVPACTRC